MTITPARAKGQSDADSFGAPVRYRRRTIRGIAQQVPESAVRATCDACGAPFWKWPDAPDRLCAPCQAKERPT